MKWASYRQIDDLVSTLYFTLKLVQTEGQRLVLAVCMRNSIDMVIVSSYTGVLHYHVGLQQQPVNCPPILILSLI